MQAGTSELLHSDNGPVQRGRVEDLPFQKRWLSASAATAGYPPSWTIICPFPIGSTTTAKPR
jgi:hypothetical protein